MAKQKIVGFRDMADFRYVADSAKRFNKERGEGSVSRPSGLLSSDDVSVVGLYNGETSNDCPAFGIMLHNGVQTTSSGIVIKGKRPDTYGCQRNFLIADSSGVKAGKGGGAQGIGPWGPDVFLAAYDSGDGTPAVGEYWSCRTGTFLAKKNTFGHQVVGIYDSSKHYALLKSTPFLSFRGKANADIASLVAGTVSIYYRSDVTTYTDTGVDTPSMVVYNGTDTTAGSGKFVWCEWAPYFTSGVYTEGWVITGHDC